MPRGGSAVPVRAMTSEAQLIQDCLQSAGIFVNRPKSGPAGQVASLLDAEGQAEAVVIDPSNNVFHACREPLSDSGWNMYGIGSGFSAIAAVDRATVWAVGTAGNVWRGARGRWSESTALPSGNAALGVAAGTDGAIWAVDSDDVSWTLYSRGVTASNRGPAVNDAIAPVLLVDRAGLLNFFCVDQQGGLWSIRQQTVGGGWGVWAGLGQPPGGVTLTSIAVAPNQDGRLQIFAVGSSGGLHTMWQQIGSGTWSAWSAIAPQDPAIAAMAVGQNADGRLEVFVVSEPDTSGSATLSHNWQTEPNGGWNGWAAGPVDYTGEPAALAVIRDGAGCLNVVLAPAYSPFCLATRQCEPNDGWTSLVQIGGFMEAAAFLALGLDGSGSLNVFAVAGSGAIQLLTQQGWRTMGRVDHPQGIAVGVNTGGRLEVFGMLGGTVYHAWQESAGGAWSDWSLLRTSCPGLASLAVTCNQAGSLEVIGLGGATSWRTVQDDTVDAAWLPFAGDWWQWYPMSGGSALASMPSGRAGDFWAIRKGGTLTRWNGRGWTNTAIASGQSALLLAVDGEGIVWVLASDQAGSFYRLAGGEVTSLPGLPGATSMGVARGLVWATAPGPGGGIALFTYRAGAWMQAASPSLCDLNWNTPPQVSVGRDGGVWMLDGGRNLWSQSMTVVSWTWDAYPAPASAPLRFLSAAKGGGACGIDADGGLWQFSSIWTPFSRPLPEGVAFAQISAGAPGTLWAIDAAGTPYSYGSPASGQAGGWQSVFDAFGEPLVQSPGTWALSRDAAYRYQPPVGSGSASWSPVADFASHFDARQISAGRDGTVVVLDIGGNLHALPPPAAPAALAGAPANLVQIAVVSADLMWALAQSPGSSSAYALYVYREGAWEQDTATVAKLATCTAVPVLSSASDGTVWLLDGDGTPRRLNWAPPEESWLAKGKTTSVSSVAAANGNAGAVNSAHAQAAWAVTADGAFRRCVSDVWADTYGALPNGAAAAGVSVGTDGSVWATDANGGLYRKQTWNQAPDSGLDGPAIVAAGLDGGGTLHLFTVDAAGQPWCAQANGANGWLDWSALPPIVASCARLVAAPAANGVLNVFCLASGQVFRSDQDGGWAAFASLGQPAGVTLTGLGIGADAVRQLYLFGLGGDGSVWFITQDPSSATGWTGWAALPVSHPATRFAALGGTGNDPGGALELFALDDQGVIYHCGQSSSAPGGWSDWWVFSAGGQGPQGPVVALSAGNQRNGPIHVAAIAADGTVYATHGQPSSPTGWSDWLGLGSIPGALPLSLALATGPDGDFNLFLRASDGGVYNARPMLGWRDWTPLGATGTEGVAFQTAIAPADGTGAIRVIAAGGGSVWQTRAQPGTDSGWADWGPLSGPQSWMPCAAPAPLAAPPVGGAGALWAVFTDGALRSSAGGSSWQQVAFPSASAPEAALSVSVGTDGVVWAITATDCYRHVGSGWTHTAARAFRQAPVGSLTSLWAVDPQGGIWRSRSGGAVWWQDTSYGGTVRQLSACGDGSIWLLDESGVASLGAGWQRAMRPTNMPGLDVGAAVTQVAAGRDESGTRYLFLVAGGALYYTYELAYHSWLAPELLSTDGVQIGSIGVTNQQDTGALIVYATATCAAQGSQIGIATRAAGERYAFSFNSAGASPFASLELAAVHAGRWCWFGVMGGSLYAGIGASGSVPPIYEVPLDEGAAPLRQLLPLPWPRQAAAPFCAVVDTSSQLWMVADIQFDGGGASAGNFLALTGPDTALPAGAASYAALLQADRWTPPQPRIYAMAGDTQAGSDPALFVLGRRDLYRSPGEALGWWISWLPLGGAYPGIFNGPPQAPTDTLFALDPSSSSLDTLRQNPATGKWTDGLVKRPSQSGDDFAEISVYATEASFADDYGNPQAGLEVTVFAETPVEAWVNNTLYRLDPFRGVTVATDPLGTLRVKTIADGLSAPSLEFQVEGLNGAGPIPGRFGGGATVSPSANVYAFLQGGGRLPLGGAPPAGLTGSALQAQFPGSYDGDTAASGIKAIASMPASTTPEGLAAALSVAIAVPHRGAVLSRRPGGELGSIFTRAWHDLKHVGETIYHAVKKAVVSAAIEIGQGVVSITLTIAGEVVLAVDMAIHKIEDAVLAAELFLTALLKTIEKGIEDFIDWLKLIFDLSNMRATQGYLIQIFAQALGAFPPLIAHAQATVDGGFTSLKEKLWGDFATITGSGSPLTQSYAPFSGLPSALSSSQTGPTQPGGAAAPAAQSDSGPVAGFSGLQNNWILRKVLDHLQIVSFPAIAGVDPASFLTHLDLHDTVSALQTAGQDLFAFIQTMAEHPKDLKSKGIVELLGAVEALITATIDLIQALADDALSLVQAMVAGLADALNTRLEIPFLDQLFEFLDEKPLTFLNLATLLLAVPSYIIYQLAFPGHGLPFETAVGEAAAPRGASGRPTDSAPRGASGRPADFGPGADSWTQAQSLAAGFFVLGMVNVALTGLMDTVTILLTPEVDQNSAEEKFKNLVAPWIPIGALVSAACGFFMRILMWPDTTGFPNVPSTPVTIAEVAAWFHYGVLSVPPVYGLAAPFIPALGGLPAQLVKTFCGVAGLISGIVMIIEGLAAHPPINAEAAVQAGIAWVPPALTCLLISPIREDIWYSSDLVFDPAWINLVADALVGLAVPILHFFAAADPVTAAG